MFSINFATGSGVFFFSSRRRHTRFDCDWSSDVCSSDLGIGVYALEKNKMINGQPARAVSFFIDGNDPDLLPLVGDGLLAADIDGKQKPAKIGRASCRERV